MFNKRSFLFLGLFLILNCIIGNGYDASKCICTTVQCPLEGINTLVMGDGGSTIDYTYILHNNIPVVSSAKGTVYPHSLDHGSETTECTQKYSRSLEDDGASNCDAGHILANRLGGYGNQPINIFPQLLSINRGSYAQFEDKIYHCIQNGASQASLSWVFSYPNSTSTMPNEVLYEATFDKGDCRTIQENFIN